MDDTLISTAGAIAAGTVALAFVIAMLVFKWFEVDAPIYGEAAKSNNPREKREIILLAHPPCGALASSSSQSCAKVETYLRMAGIPFKKECGNPALAPRNMLPFIKHGIYEVPNGTLIIKYLQNTFPDKALAEPSDPRKMAVAAACVALAEGRLKAHVAYGRWIEAFEWVEENYFKELNFFWKLITPSLQRRKIFTILQRGPGSLTAEERKQDLREGLSVLSTILGDQPFFVGESPTAADAAIFGLLDQIYFDFSTNEAPKRVAVEFENLLRYTLRLRARFYPEAPVLQDNDTAGMEVLAPGFTEAEEAK